MDKKIDPRQLRREATRRWLIAAGCIVTMGVALFIIKSLMTPTVNASEIILSTVDVGPLETAVPATGRVVPLHEETVISPVSTRVLRAYVQAGDTVSAGTPLLELDLRSQQTDLDKQQDRLDMSRQELEQLKLSHRTLLSDLEMQIKVSEMQVNRLAIEVDNERRLDSLGSGTGDRVRQAETAYAAGCLELQQLRTKLDNERLRTASAERAQQLNISTAAKDLTLISSTMEQGRVPAPIDGIVTFIVADNGTQVSGGERVAMVADLSRFKLNGEIAEGSADRIGIGSKLIARIGKTELTGTITNITPQAKGGMISFMARLDDPSNERLRAGLRTDLYIAYGYKDNVVRVPSGAYFKGPGVYEMFVVDEDNTLVKRGVRLGDSNREWIEVISGLHPGDRVATGDMEAYSKRSKIKIK